MPARFWCLSHQARFCGQGMRCLCFPICTWANQSGLRAGVAHFCRPMKRTRPCRGWQKKLRRINRAACFALATALMIAAPRTPCQNAIETCSPGALRVPSELCRELEQRAAVRRAACVQALEAASSLVAGHRLHRARAHLVDVSSYCKGRRHTGRGFGALSSQSAGSNVIAPLFPDGRTAPDHACIRLLYRRFTLDNARIAQAFRAARHRISYRTQGIGGAGPCRRLVARNLKSRILVTAITERLAFGLATTAQKRPGATVQAFAGPGRDLKRAANL